MTEQIIKFRDLSIWLKLSIIGGWGLVTLYGIGFLVGFLEGIGVIA